MPDEILPEPAPLDVPVPGDTPVAEPMPETVPEGPTLRYPDLPASHFRNIIDPESPIQPADQVDAYRKAHPRIFRR